MRPVGIPAVFHRPVRQPALRPHDGLKPQNAVGGQGIHTKCQFFPPAGRRFTGSPERHASCESIVAKSRRTAFNPYGFPRRGHGLAPSASIFPCPIPEIHPQVPFPRKPPIPPPEPHRRRWSEFPAVRPRLAASPGDRFPDSARPKPGIVAVLSKSKILPPGNRGGWRPHPTQLPNASTSPAPTAEGGRFRLDR